MVHLHRCKAGVLLNPVWVASTTCCLRAQFGLHHVMLCLWVLLPELSWKEELKEKHGAYVCLYKQISNKGQVLGSSW